MNFVNRHTVSKDVISAILITAVLITFYWPFAAKADLRSNVSSWLQAYSPVSPEYALSARVQSIFKKIKRVSGRAVVRSQLYILDSDSEPWAIALQDGNIILTRGAIDIIYGASDESLAAKDARMAFVIGHELKHIIDNDFWHEFAYETFADRKNLEKLDLRERNHRKKLELRADEDGFLLASLAGFDTREVFSSIGSTENFLVYWARQTNTMSGSSHFKPNERIEYLQERLRSLDSAVNYFKFGISLAYFGRFEEARMLLDEFYSIYPSEQVVNNLAYVHIQQARLLMSPQLSHRFWFPGLLELETGLPKEMRGVVVPLPEEAFEHLDYAVSLLEQGVKMNPGNINSRLNLASAYMYLGRASAAEDILQTVASENKQLGIMRLIAAAMSLDSTDRWSSNARKKLEQYAASDAAKVSTIYNYARITQTLDKDKVAKYFWNILAYRFDEVPLPFQQMVCKEIRSHQVCQKQRETFSVRDSGWNSRITPGENTDSRRVRRELKNWGKSHKERIGGSEIEIYRRNNGDSLLVINQVIEIISIKDHGIDFKEHLRDRSGPPTSTTEMGLGEIWSYGETWSATVRDNRVEEIWLSRKKPDVKE